MYIKPFCWNWVSGACRTGSTDVDPIDTSDSRGERQHTGSSYSMLGVRTIAGCNLLGNSTRAFSISTDAFSISAESITANADVLASEARCVPR